ncbi:carbonyl reductase [NADPH] 1, partial [Clonorchis sinensis]
HWLEQGNRLWHSGKVGQILQSYWRMGYFSHWYVWRLSIHSWSARNDELGKKSCEELKSKGLDVKFHQLDITDKASRKRFLEYMKTNYPNGINVAVNNAGIAYRHDSTAPFGEQARVTVHTNFTCTLDFTLEFLPLLAKDARVVHVSSGVSLMMFPKMSNELYTRITSPLTLEELRTIIQEFVKYAEAGEHSKHGWPTSAYGVSKVGLTKASFILGEMLKSDPRNIVMNSCCPGYVDTDMTSHKGTKTIEEGADTPFYLATLPVGVTEPVNEFVRDRQITKWSKETTIRF